MKIESRGIVDRDKLDISYGYIRGTSFEQAVNGVKLTDDYGEYSASWNPWYSYLGLDGDKCVYIASQLTAFKTELRHFKIESEDHGVSLSSEAAKYGVDAYGNAWTLVK